MGAIPQHNDAWPWPAAQVHGPDRRAAMVLVCEHASAFIPPPLEDLGLTEDARYSHAAWDIGAFDLAVALADTLVAPLVAGAMSRLVYDCNRPLEAPDCVPAQSEVFAVPGNADLTAAERASRSAHVHAPFHAQVAALLADQAVDTALVTIHTFTPVYHGQARDVDVGLLFHGDDRLARAVQSHLGDAHRVALNEPYSAADGVTHTLEMHGRDRPHLMIEVRNDLVGCPDAIADMANTLAQALAPACAGIAP